MNNLLLMIMLSIVMIVVAIPFIVRSLLWNRVLKLLKQGRYEKVLTKLNSTMFKLFFREYDRNYNMLRVYLAQADNKKIEEQTKILLEKKLTTSQSYQVASQTYYYFLDRENKEICTKLLGFLKNAASQEEYEYSTMLYRILIEKKSEDIQQIETLLEAKAEEKIKRDQQMDQQVQLGILQYLIGVQYSYKKERTQMEHYLNKAKSNLKNTPYQKKVKQLLRTS